MTIADLIDSLKELGAVAAALTAIGGLLWWVAFRPFKAFIRSEVVENLVGIKDATEESTEVARAVQHELHAHITDPDAHGGRV